LPVALGPVYSNNYTNGRTYTWNASIEHQFGNNWLAKVAYVASESDHVPYQQNIDLARQSAVQSA